MTKGEITGNTTPLKTDKNHPHIHWYDNGGGVYNLGDFKLFGGTISNNTANDGGGVCTTGTFEMTAGTITKNTATAYNKYASHETMLGGGVYVAYRGGYFMLSGGIITKNTASGGGGVFVSPRSELTMSGGEISGNTASDSGGGVYTVGDSQHGGQGVFTITGGLITNNTARNEGGGVYNFSGKFNVWGGEILDNKPTDTYGPINYNLQPTK